MDGDQGAREGARVASGDNVPDWLRTSAGWAWRLAVLVIVGLSALGLMARLLIVSLPVLVALILTTICAPLAQRLRDRGWKPAAAAGTVVIGGLVVLLALIAVLTPSFVSQLRELGPTLASAWDAVLDWLETGPLGYDRAEIEEFVSGLVDTASSGSGSLVTGVLAGVGYVTQGLASLALLVVLLFFFVKDGEDIVAWFLARTPDGHRETVSAVGRRAWNALGGYVRGTALIALIDALGIGIALLILGVPLVGPLVFLIFLGGFIPVIGAFAAGMVAVLVALADGGPVIALLTLASILVIQQLEGNLLQPMIMRRAVSLHPVVILVALAAGASLAGIVGAFLSVPVAAVVAAMGNELRLRGEVPLVDADAEPATP